MAVGRSPVTVARINLIFSDKVSMIVIYTQVGFLVLMVVSMKITAFWDIVLCSLKVNRYFRGDSSP
jgi:hypothetical protein